MRNAIEPNPGAVRERRAPKDRVEMAMELVLQTRGCYCLRVWVVGGGEVKADMATYFQGFEAQKSGGIDGETCVIYCRDDVVSAGQGCGHFGWRRRKKMTEALEMDRMKGFAMHVDCEDAAQSATHLDVLACVVAS